MSRLSPPSRTLSGAGLRIGLVASRFNEEIVGRLLEGALAALDGAGVAPEARTVVRVPGAWEIPLAAMAKLGRWDALVALGAVVRGETPHFDIVAGECSRGAAAVAREHGVPVTFGVLTCDTLEQAMARAGGDAGNKGAEAAEAAIELATELARLGA
jgi:6,7-dimethyl-8-ribityllumazine synthase